MWCKSGILFHNCPFYFFLLVIVEKNWSSNKELTGFTEKSLPHSTLPPPLVSLPSPPIPPPCSAPSPPPPPPQVTMRPCSPSRLFKTLLDLLITAGVFFFSFLLGSSFDHLWWQGHTCTNLMSDISACNALQQPPTEGPEGKIYSQKLFGSFAVRTYSKSFHDLVFSFLFFGHHCPIRVVDELLVVFTWCPFCLCSKILDYI